MSRKRLPDTEYSKQNVVQQEAKVEEKVERGITRQKKFDKEAWQPRTSLGLKVKNGEIKDIDLILEKGLRILEPEIVDVLKPNLGSDLIAVGQSKGKFGGGKRSIWRQTQKKTEDGNRPTFSSLVVVGDREGHIGIGLGKSRETLPAREKATRKAKLNLIKVRRGCGSWECTCGEPHSIPFKVSSKCSSVKVELLPAPKGTDLCIEKECKKLLELAGIRDVYSRTFGQTNTKLNLIYACFDALKKLSKLKVQPKYFKSVGIKG